MFSHIFVGVGDFTRALAFYTPLMELLGAPLRFRDDSRPWAGWQTAPGPRPLFLIGRPFDGQAHQPGNGQMVAFTAADRATVDRIHALALELGGRSEGLPGLRPDYHAHYYGAYFRDLDGNKIGVVCHDPAQPVNPIQPTTKSQKQRMLAGELYTANDAELQADLKANQAWLDRYNLQPSPDCAQRRALLREHLGCCGEGAAIRAPFHCDYGYNIHLGAGAFLNFNCVILDVVRVDIGERTQIGPGVQILTADHPKDPVVRSQGLEFGRPITIGRDVWIGGGALILPGVNVGDGAVIGAGSVVTRDVAPGGTVVGNPARPLRA